MNLRFGITDKQQACLVVEEVQCHFVTKTAGNISTYNELDKVSTQKYLTLSSCLQHYIQNTKYIRFHIRMLGSVT